MPFCFWGRLGPRWSEKDQCFQEGFSRSVPPRRAVVPGGFSKPLPRIGPEPRQGWPPVSNSPEKS